MPEVRFSLLVALLTAGGCGHVDSAGSTPAVDASRPPGSGGVGGAGGRAGGVGGMVSAGTGGVVADAALDSAPPADSAAAGGAGGSTVDAAPIDVPPVNPGSGPMPPATWQEHWFEHSQNVKLVSFDEHAAIYFDDDVSRASAQWLLPFVSRIWQYSKRTYGEGFGPDPRIFSIHHQGRYGGGHPSYYFDASHDNRNVSDCGPGPWTENAGAMDMVSHEISHVVESANNGAQGSPGFAVWKDS